MSDENTTTLILLGPPLSGKGTLATRLATDLGLTHISTGDLFREHLKNNTPLGQQAKQYMESGNLVPDDLVLDMLFERIASEKNSGGVLLDGFPRTHGQAEAFDQRLNKGASPVVIQLDAPDEAIVARAANRLSCPHCGRTYSKTHLPPKQEGVCDNCGGELIHREDDREEVMRERLKVYHEKTKPLIDYYRSRNQLHAIDAQQAPDAVYQQASKIVAL